MGKAFSNPDWTSMSYSHELISIISSLSLFKLKCDTKSIIWWDRFVASSLLYKESSPNCVEINGCAKATCRSQQKKDLTANFRKRFYLLQKRTFHDVMPNPMLRLSTWQKHRTRSWSILQGNFGWQTSVANLVYKVYVLKGELVAGLKHNVPMGMLVILGFERACNKATTSTGCDTPNQTPEWFALRVRNVY